MKLSEHIHSGKQQLRQANLQCADPNKHMVQIAAAALGISVSDVYLQWDDELGLRAQAIENFLGRRLKGEPFQYIVGHEWFWNSQFEVGPGVLIPRRETEGVVEWLLEKLPTSPQRISELGAGSGNIGIATILERPQWKWAGYEKSPEGWPFLEKNVRSFLKDSNYQIHREDFFEAQPDGDFDAVVSNPPYVSEDQLSSLSKEVLHEPRLALDGGTNGIDVIRRLAERAKSWVRAGGFLVLEIGSDQEELARRCLSEQGWQDIECRKDYAGLPRVLSGRRSH